MVEIAKKKVETLLIEQILRNIEEIPLVHLVALQAMIEAFKIHSMTTPTLIKEDEVDWHRLFNQLKLKSASSSLSELPKKLETGNYNKQALFKAFERAQQKGVFKNITNAVEWQKQIRNEE